MRNYRISYPSSLGYSLIILKKKTIETTQYSADGKNKYIYSLKGRSRFSVRKVTVIQNVLNTDHPGIYYNQGHLLTPTRNLTWV